jgi:hypothetical protein
LKSQKNALFSDIGYDWKYNSFYNEGKNAVVLVDKEGTILRILYLTTMEIEEFSEVEGQVGFLKILEFAN